MHSDRSSLGFRVGHCHVQLTGLDMCNFTTDGKRKKISKVQNGLLYILLEVGDVLRFDQLHAILNQSHDFSALATRFLFPHSDQTGNAKKLFHFRFSLSCNCSPADE